MTGRDVLALAIGIALLAPLFFWPSLMLMAVLTVGTIITSLGAHMLGSFVLAKLGR